MRTIRVLAIATLVLIGGYFVFRLIVSACTGAACDAYIPLSLFIPVLILLLVAVTGSTASVHARGHHSWLAALIAATVVGVAGPLIALAVFKDRPDAFVLTAAILSVIAAGAALIYTFSGARDASVSSR